jgi:hypothetical protein
MPADLVEGLDTETRVVMEEEGMYRGMKQREDDGATAQVAGEADTGAYPSSLAELRSYIEKQNRRSDGVSASGLKSGMRVRHAQFGDGIILSRERMGADHKLTITFSRVGRKSLMEKFAKLQPL